MGKNEFANLGDEIKEAVQSAINKGDFARLKAEIGESVNQAFDEIKQSIQGTWTDSNVKRPNGQPENDSSGEAHAYQGMPEQNRNRNQENRGNYSQTARRNQANRAYSQAAAQTVRSANRTAAQTGSSTARYANRAAAQAGSSAARYANRAAAQAGKSAARSAAEIERVSGTVVNARKPKLPALPVRPVGKVGGILFTIFGSILLGLGLLCLMLFTSLGLVMSEESLYFLAMLFGIPATFSGALMLSAGRLKSNRLFRMNQYVKLIGAKGYCDIKELAAKSGRSIRYLVKDLGKMIRLGMFPEGHMDEKKTCFMLDDKTHQLYLEMMQARNEAGIQETAEIEKEEQETEEDARKAAAKAVAAEGNAYIQQIRQANAAIAGEEISAKLDRLSMVMDKIFLHVERHPEQVEELHRFMEYYLPTTLKLVNAYQEFDAQPVQGANITTAKQEIEETLDTINQAFERLFDNFYADVAMDISTDIDVLETMLAQEGLTGHSFEEKKEA